MRFAIWNAGQVRLLSSIFITTLLMFMIERAELVSGDIFSSTSHLRNLMYLERHLVSSMSEFVYNAEIAIQEMKNYIGEFMESAGQERFQGTFSENLIANPLQAFQMIKRLSIQFRKIERHMRKAQWGRVAEMSRQFSHLMPTEEDLNGAALSVIRLQDTYNLTQQQLSVGQIRSVNSQVMMNGRDCLFFAKQSFNHGYYGHALQWFERALELAHREKNRTASVDEIMPFYQIALNVHNELSPSYWGNQTEYAPDTPIPDKIRYFDGDNDDYRKYQRLCRSEGVQNPAKTKHLKCYLSDQGSAWLLLQPVKVEVFHSKPYVVMFHDLLSDKESNMIRKLAAPKLKRAKVQTETSTEDEVSNTRTSQTAWFSPDQHEFVERINRRIGEATQLSADMQLSHSELMQVANYGMGGHYTPHYDYLIVDRPEEERHLVPEREYLAGDRTATLMFYLSDVAEGGSTVFPRLGVQLKPRKNSAAFWYNLYRNGEGIIETIHGACPVLIGEKWVANHWLRANGQTFLRRCSLNKDE